MIRQEIFNNVIGQRHQIMQEQIPEVINLYVAYRMANAMSQRGIVPKVKLDGQVEIALNNLHVDKGQFMADFIDMRQQERWSGASIRFGNGLVIVALNTWVDPEVEAPSEEDADKLGKRNERRRDNHRDFRANEVMDMSDEYLFSSLYDQAMSEVLTLVTEARKMHSRPANTELVEGIVYNLNEENRMYAAYELVSFNKPSMSDPKQGMKDIVVCHVMTGELEFGFSGHFGTEQQWIKAVGARYSRGGSRPRQEVELTDFERGFFDFFTEYEPAAIDEQARDRMRNSSRNRY